jgi:dTDP-glucose pyrophosphorylase
MLITIPMAGAGTRFRNAGYRLPKPLIDLRGKPMIERVLDNLGRPCPPSVEVRHVLLALNDHLDAYKVYFQKELTPRLVAAGYKPPVLVPVHALTEGQASTCLLATAHIDNSEPLLIANSDQIINWTPYDFITRAERDHLDGIILTFTSRHPNNSYVELAPSGLVARTVEKVVVSDLATCGLYFWTQGRDFVRSAYDMIRANDRCRNEFYVCPAYNYLIARGGRVGIQHVDEHWPIGTPEELVKYLEMTK